LSGKTYKGGLGLDAVAWLALSKALSWSFEPIGLPPR
jgi:hypothetical protein